MIKHPKTERAIKGLRMRGNFTARNVGLAMILRIRRQERAFPDFRYDGLGRSAAYVWRNALHERLFRRTTSPKRKIIRTT